MPAQCYDDAPGLIQDEVEVEQTLPDWLAEGWEWAVPDQDYMAWTGPNMGADGLAGIRALAYRNRISDVGSTKLINFWFAEKKDQAGNTTHLGDEAASIGWEANQWDAWDAGKPETNYAYTANQHVKRHYPVLVGEGLEWLTRDVTDPHEAMSMVEQSMTKASGAEGRTRGSIIREIDLNGPGLEIGLPPPERSKWKHEAVFGRAIFIL